MTVALQLEDEAACTRLCVAFANHLDARDYPRVLDLFSEDGSLDRMGTLLTGQREIAAFLDARPAAVVTRHLCTNISVSLESEDEATGFCCVLFFQGRADGDSALMSGPPSVVEYHDRYRRTAAGWKIQARRIRMAMRS
jgi:3-phenylpropionate/cinnamic acid dioxygenase small subunit